MVPNNDATTKGARSITSNNNNEYYNGMLVCSPYTTNSTVKGGFSTTSNKFASSGGNNTAMPASDPTTITISKKHNNKSAASNKHILLKQRFRPAGAIECGSGAGEPGGDPYVVKLCIKCHRSTKHLQLRKKTSVASASNTTKADNQQLKEPSVKDAGTITTPEQVEDNTPE